MRSIVGGGEPEVAGRRVLRGVLGVDALGIVNTDGRRVRKAQRHLARRRAVRAGDLLQHAAARRWRAGEAPWPKGL